MVSRPNRIYGALSCKYIAESVLREVVINSEVEKLLVIGDEEDPIILPLYIVVLFELEKAIALNAGRLVLMLIS